MRLSSAAVRTASRLFAVCLAAFPSVLAQDDRPTLPPWTPVLEAPADHATVQNLVLRSPTLSAFHGRDVFFQATAILPDGHRRGERLATVYHVHGFGGTHLSGRRRGERLIDGMSDGTYPRMLHVYLNAQCPTGHHVFADSVNNGPWGTALVEEFVPWVEEKYGAFGAPEGRFLTGHSSGGWSTLWLQVAYPDAFGGTWPTAPDSVDFRDFTGIDIYRFDSAYTDPDGAPIQLVRRGEEWVASIEQFVEREERSGPIGGQMQSFDAVFGPRADDGRPMPLFDRETGSIDRAVAFAWEPYDIRLVVERNAEVLRDKLAGKVHLYIGTLDTFRLEGAAKLLAESFERLGIEGTFVFAEGRNHGDLFRPHPELWPDGLMARILGEMQEAFEARTGARETERATSRRTGRASGAAAGTAAELLARTIAFHDPERVWGRGTVELDCKTVYADGSSEKPVHLVIGPSSFALTGSVKGRSRDATYELDYRVVDRTTTVHVDGSDELTRPVEEDLHLAAEDGLFWRNYYGFLLGLPMVLDAPGTHLVRGEPTDFRGRAVDVLRVTFDAEVGGETWDCYLDRTSGEMVGCTFFHEEEDDGEVIVCEGLVSAESSGENGGLRLPAKRSWYVTADDTLLGTDVVSGVRVLR